MFDCGDDPNSHRVLFDNFSNNWYILVHLHLGYQTPNTIRLNCIETALASKQKICKRKIEVHLTTSTLIMERCSTFGEMTRDVSLLAPVWKK